MRAEPLQMLYSDVEKLQRAIVAEILPTGEIVVRLDDVTEQMLVCNFLETSEKSHLILEAGDRVLVLAPGHSEEKGCVLGKIGSYRKPNRKQIVIDAEEELTIRCGKGSITIRKSGKVLIRGLEIVSHSKGANRIRGGSVHLN